MRALIGNNCSDQKVSDPISTILALGILAGILAIGMWFAGMLVSFINPLLAVEYYVAAILIAIIAFYSVLYFARYK